MEKSHKLLIWDRAICTGLYYLEKMSSHVFMRCVECLWSSGGAERQPRGNSTEEATNCSNTKGGEMWTCEVEEDLRETSGNLSGLVFPKQVFNLVYTIYLYALVKINSFIQSSTEFCISVAQDCMQTPKQQETYLVVKNPSETQETWVQSLGQQDPLEERAWQPTPYSCLENPTDRGAWRVIVHSVAQNWTQLKRLCTHTHADSRTEQLETDLSYPHIQTSHSCFHF